MAPASGEPHSFWDAVRSWADSAGLLLPPDPEKAADTGPVADVPRPKVPQAVCDSCPICQAAATLDQVNPRVVADLTEVARSVITGLTSALNSAADQRAQGSPAVEPGDEPPTEHSG